MTELNLQFDIKFKDLYSRDGLIKLDAVFIKELENIDVELHNRLVKARSDVKYLEKKDESQLLIDIAPYFEDFIGKLFNIESELNELVASHNELDDIYKCKRVFIQRRASKICKAVEAAELNANTLQSRLEEFFGEPLTEESFSKHVMQWITEKGIDIEGCEEKVIFAGKYASWALNTAEGIKEHKNGVLFKQPKKLDFANLVPVETEVRDGITVANFPKSKVHQRDGFKLTDDGGSLKEALSDANYCIWCHKQDKDSCSTGLKEKPDAETGKAAYKTSPTNVKQAGCPLEEKISEMNILKSQGVPLGALAVVAVDNPLCAATGHRICNDCMKACIYQKQEPVNIPQTETRTLQDILDLPWGFEIYSLLTRWNPLNIRQPLPKVDSGYKVLVSGLGPSGFALSHNLLNEGHTIIAIDGLKIEPLPEDISGVKVTGEKTSFRPIKDVRAELFESLDERVLAGFGGVAEYGITVRWNKNYLKIIRLLLERRTQFAMYGGVRFGSTITYDKAFELGFDHIALCMGAGKPTIVSMPNALARGVRTASDFLMSLQLTGAAKENSIANLQLRLPVVVIGGGLTAIDAATESLAYYPLQVEKFLKRYEILAHERGEVTVRASWSEEETEIAEEFIIHARAMRNERKKAAEDNRVADITGLLKKWGGATIAYRRRLQDSPSYRMNHEEVEKALEEGIEFIGNVSPAGAKLNEFGQVVGLRVNYTYEGEDGRIEMKEKSLRARTIFMAAGTSPNTVLAREDEKHFELDGKYFVAIDEDGNKVTPEPNISKPEVANVLMSKNDDGKFVSFFGDLHPSFVGNVVKALGSAKQGYPVVTSALEQQEPLSSESSSEFIGKMSNQLIATVHKVERLTPTIIEITLKAPLAAEEFKPGQFYRLQNFEALATKTDDGTILSMEGLALTGAWVDKAKGLISVIVLEMGGSADLCAYLKIGEPVVLMGPTGTATETPAGETVMLVGGGLGNAVLFSIGKAFRDAGSKVLYFAGYKQKQDRYKVAEIEKAADTIIWCCDEGEFTPERDGDKTFHGNIVQAMAAYGEGKLGDNPINMQDVDRIICIGSDRMMSAVGQARHNILKGFLKPDHIAVGSINSPMQCMMKEICAQCLQRHIDPETGERYYVYSCFNQDQNLDSVDFHHLNERLKQNTIQEKITALWIDRSLKSIGLRGDKVA